ncbi:MAG TPA: VOC family protein [Thermoflexales bacterium]|nr:VOC family protein [Thermoflexales bacterium]HQW35019.1 VOC family protein [Thermoflexales bacterium]HQZ21844.1 VOC family protein [Thermoflexales bacterium]HQZ99452.1 VOC family protein [Thermoflexales bacterium]
MAIHTLPKADGAPTWLDLMSTDPAGSRAFYAKLFGWTYDISGPEFGYYAMAKLNGKEVAGIGGQPPGVQMPSVWNTYFATSNLAADIDKATWLGGHVMMPAMQIADNGSLAMLTDPTGASFGLWQAGKHIGARLTDEPGTMTWHEMYSHDAKKAVAFYTKMLNAISNPVPGGMEYYMLQHGEARIAGIMQMTLDMGKIPSMWSNYWVVKNADTAAKLTVDNGGQLMGEILDIPFGRMAMLFDPQGALFKVLQPN